MSNEIFNTVIIPDVPQASGKARFSICLELNTEHPVLQTPSTGDVTEWVKQVGNFYNQLDYLKSNVIVRLSSGSSRHDTSPLSEYIIDEFPNSNYDQIRKDIWCAFTGYKRLSPNDSIFTNSSKKAGKQKFALEVKKLAELASNTFYLSEPVQVGFGHPEASSLTQDFNLSVFANHIIQTIAVDDAAKTKAIREGIGRASEVFRIKNGQRNQVLTQTAPNAPFTGAVIESFMYEAESKLALSVEAQLMSRQQKEEVQSLLRAYGEYLALLLTVNNEPPMIQKALDQINNTILLRKFMRTLLTIEMESENVPDGGFEIQLIDITDQPPHYFGYQLITHCKRSAFDNRIIPAVNTEDTIHDEGFLKIGDQCEIRNYEPEAVIMNANAGLRDLAENDPGIKSHTVELGQYRNRLLTQLHQRPVTLEDRQTNQQRLGVMAKNKTALDAGRRLHNQINNTETKGQALYLKNELVGKFTDDNNLYLGDLIMGYAVFARKKGETKWISLTEVREDFTFSDGNLKAVPADAELGVNVEIGMLSTTDASGASTSGMNILKSKFVFLWDGTKVGSMNPMQQYEKDKTLEIDRMEEFLQESKDDVEAEILAIENRTRKQFSVEWFPYKKHPADSIPTVILKRSFYFNRPSLKLKFGDTYEYVLAAQLKNGYVFLKSAIENAVPSSPINETIEACKTKPAEEPKFLRHQHIKDCVISLKTNIYEQEGSSKLLPNHLGESHTDLVVRTGQLLSNKESSRYILPPPIPSFQVYLWYKREESLQNRQLSADASNSWFLRYQCELEDEAHFNRNLQECRGQDNCFGCRAECKRYCKGNKQPRIYPNALHYLPDPIVTGFIVKLYADPERTKEMTTTAGGTYPEPFCKFEGRYPQWQPWEIVLKKDPKEGSLDTKIEVNQAAKQLTIFIEKGKRIYADIIPTYLKDNSSFFPTSLPFDLYSSEVGDGKSIYNSLVSNITRLTLTHACQYPITKPSFRPQSVVVHRYFKEADLKLCPVKEDSMKMEVDLLFEHVNLYAGVPLPGLVPTGELELYGLWDDYSNNSKGPHKSIQEKKTSGFLRLGTIKFRDYNNAVDTLRFDGTDADHVEAFTAEKITFTMNPELSIPHHTDISLKIRNTSQFSSFFKADEVTTEEEKSAFSIWSDEITVTSSANPVDGSKEASAAKYVFNNKKLPAPRIAKVVPLKITDTYSDYIRELQNWIRFYFEPDGMNESGKDQRIAIILGKKNNRLYLYQNYFNSHQYVSQAGIDSVTSRFDKGSGQPTITHENIILHLDDNYAGKFQPRYEAAGSSPDQTTLELVSYIPDLDTEQNLWYIDVGFNLRREENEIHTVFAQLSFLFYQKCSSNYNLVSSSGIITNEDSKLGFEKDCRFSFPTQADFISVFPSRTYRNHYVLLRRDTTESFVFAPEVSSLYFKGSMLLTQFYVFVQRKGNYWKTIASVYNTSSGSVTNKFHPVLPTSLSPNAPSSEYKFNLDWEGSGVYRVMIMEIDYINEGKGLDNLTNLLEKAGEVEISDIPGVWVRNITEINSERLV